MRTVRPKHTSSFVQNQKSHQQEGAALRHTTNQAAGPMQSVVAENALSELMRMVRVLHCGEYFENKVYTSCVAVSRIVRGNGDGLR